MKTRSLLVLVVLTGLLFDAFHASTRVRGAQQNGKHRTIARLPIERNEPVRIRAVKFKGMKVRHRQKFLADDDWLSGLTVTIKNRTNKTITFAAIDIQFPRPIGSEGPTAFHTIEYGNRALLTHRAGADDRSSGIAPGESVDLALTPHDLSGIAFLLSATGYHSAAEKLNLSVGHVIFEDDTMWYAGSPAQRDPNVPGSWINAEVLAKSESSGRGPVSSARSDGFSRDGLSDRWNLSSSFERSPGMRSFFLPASYTTRPPTTCNEWLTTTHPGCNTYSWCGAECRYVQDSLTTQAGNYFLGQGAGLCESAACPNQYGSQNCNTYRTTSVKNTCSGGGGGGGGGSEGSCFSSEECDFGFACSFGHCTDDFMWVEYEN
jgi:hypothetical protein